MSAVRSEAISIVDHLLSRVPNKNKQNQKGGDQKSQRFQEEGIGKQWGQYQP